MGRDTAKTDGAPVQAAPTPAEACATLDQVRAEIDRIDEALVAGLAERQRYLDAAARLKTDAPSVRDPARVEEMVARMRAAARTAGLDPAIAEEVWRALAEAGAAYQERLLAARPGDPRDSS